MKIIMMALIGHLLVGTITGMARQRPPISLQQKTEMALNSMNNYFGPLEDNSRVMVLKKGEKWFDTVMLRGFIELYRVTNNARYLHSFESSLRQACKEKTPQ